FSSRRRHTRWPRDWSSDVCSSDLPVGPTLADLARARRRLARWPPTSRGPAGGASWAIVVALASVSVRGAVIAPSELAALGLDEEIGRASCREGVWMGGGRGWGPHM